MGARVHLAKTYLPEIAHADGEALTLCVDIEVQEGVRRRRDRAEDAGETNRQETPETSQPPDGDGTRNGSAAA